MESDRQLKERHAKLMHTMNRPYLINLRRFYPDNVCLSGPATRKLVAALDNEIMGKR